MGLVSRSRMILKGNLDLIHIPLSMHTEIAKYAYRNRDTIDRVI